MIFDGTLADVSHRLHFIRQEPADWRAFFAACPGDRPIDDVIYISQALHEAGATIKLITGRSDEIRAETEAWLAEFGVSYESMFMRKAGDHREDSAVKAELLDQLKAESSEPIWGVFEDRRQVVDMYRAKGLRVFQVAAGEF